MSTAYFLIGKTLGKYKIVRRLAEVPMALVMKHINEPVPARSRLVVNSPAGLEAVILKMLMKQPEKRFLTAGEVAAALRHRMGWEAPPAAIVSVTTAAGMAPRTAREVTEEAAAVPRPNGDEPEAPLVKQTAPPITTPPDGIELQSGKPAISPMRKGLRWTPA